MFFVCILIAKRTPKLRVTTEIFHLGHGGTKPTIQYESKGLVGEKPEVLINGDQLARSLELRR